MLYLHRVVWSFYFPHEKYLCAIWWHGTPTSSGDSYGHKLCSTYSRRVSILLQEGFYGQKSKRFDLIYDFNNTSRYILYLVDIFTIDNPKFAEHIPNIYPREHQLKIKANISDKETYFMDLNKNKIFVVIFTLALTTNAMIKSFL